MEHRNFLTCAAAVALVATFSAQGFAEESLKPGAESVVKQFNETAETFANPGQGWMTMQRMPHGDGRFPYSVAYFRLNWDELEPAEGQYDWRLIDESLQAWGKREVRIAFRIMTANAHSKGYYCSPKWLFDAGCRSFDYVEGGADPTSGGSRIKRVEPDYGDPLYLEKHGRFIKALAQRYDGNPGIEFIDIGSYGIWGEWHTTHPQPWPVRKQIIDMYLNGFRKTQLVSMSDDAEALAYALAHGTGFRRDGVGSPWHEANWIGSKKYAAVTGFAEQWKKAPVVFEWFGDYQYLRQRGWSFDRALDFMKANHVTLINDNVGRVPSEQMPKLEQLARLAGYRFVLREVSHPSGAVAGKKLAVKMKWSNVGVGKLYRRYPLALYLLDTKGTVVCCHIQPDSDPTQWLPGDTSMTGLLPVPDSVGPGRYTLAVALVDAATKQPAVGLAIDAPHRNRVYQLTEIAVGRAAEPALTWPQWHGPTRDCFVGGPAWPTSSGKGPFETALARRSGTGYSGPDCGRRPRLRGRNQGKENRDRTGVGSGNRPRTVEGRVAGRNGGAFHG